MAPSTRSQTLPQRRPAETATSITGAVVGILALLLDLGPEWTGPLTVIVGQIPACVTFVVDLVRARARGD